MTWMRIIDKYYIKKPKIRRFVTKLFYGDRDICIDILDTKLKINTIKENGYLRASRISKSSSLLRDELSVMINLAGILSENDTFIDVGSNIGIYSSIFSRFAKLWPNFNVYAFEANPDTFKRLKMNSEEYKFIARNIAISEQESELSFIGGAVSHVFTTIDNVSEYHIKDQTVSIKCSRLDHFEINGNSLIIKIDVEGQELEVLTGAKNFFEQNRVKAVYLDGYRRREVMKFLSDYNFELYEGRKIVKTTEHVFSLLAIKKGTFKNA